MTDHEINIAPIADYLLNNKKLAHWNDIMEEWHLAIERYCRITKNDNPYWYNERANIGVLAGAAWRCGKIALEEFQHSKAEVKDDPETEKVEKSGRCDLWISGEKFANHIEAKFKWVNLTSDRRVEFADICLNNAIEDVQKLSGIENYSGVGIAFLPVYVKSSKINSLNELADLINATINDYKSIKCDLIAWTFPKQFRHYKSEISQNYLPGIFMLAKKI